VSTVLKEVYPRLGKNTLQNRKSRILTWSNDATDATAAPSKTVKRRAEELAYFVNAGASCDVIPAAETIVRMLNRADMTLIRENVQRLLQEEYHELNVDRVITNGLVKFIRHHLTKGQFFSILHKTALLVAPVKNGIYFIVAYHRSRFFLAIRENNEIASTNKFLC
jgi:hypothetical protein